MTKNTEIVLEAIQAVYKAKVNVATDLAALKTAIIARKTAYDTAINERKALLLELDADKLNPSCQRAHEAYRATLQAAIADPLNCLVDPTRVFCARETINAFLTEAGQQFLDDRINHPEKKDKLTLGHIADKARFFAAAGKPDVKFQDLKGSTVVANPLALPADIAWGSDADSFIDSVARVKYLNNLQIGSLAAGSIIKEEFGHEDELYQCGLLHCAWLMANNYGSYFPEQLAMTFKEMIERDELQKDVPFLKTMTEIKGETIAADFKNDQHRVPGLFTVMRSCKSTQNLNTTEDRIDYSLRRSISAN